jgi:hypothetical protein
MTGGCAIESSLAAHATADPFLDGGPAAAPLACTVSGPYETKNLAVYLVHGPGAPRGKDFLTLGDAIDRRLATVKETGEVNRLRIDNRSDSDVFAHSGQIVKGGRQDRTLAFDLIVSAGSSGTPVEAFCVESGRWTGRSGESAGNFGQSSALVASYELKQAILEEASQSAVWNAVAAVQDNLGNSIRRNVASAQSPTSLQLTLENDALRAYVREYTNGLGSLVDDHSDAIGYACVINGRLACAEVYGSHSLFTGMWPRLLAANAVESVSMFRESPAQGANRRSIAEFIRKLDSGEPSVRSLNDRTRICRYATDSGVLYETVDASRGAWVHRTYMSRMR